jgi:exodeoxyribonuclease VII large subunit
MQVTLFELNGLIKKTIESYLPSEIWVVAEIGDINHSPQGHAYLDFVEKKGNQIIAKIKANIWSYSYLLISGRFEKITGQPLSKGMKILSLVKVSFHEQYGISLTVKDIDPNFTLGEKARIRMEIIERLTNERLIDKNKKINLPRLPQNVAVISSPTAAGYGDFLDQIHNNSSAYAVNVTLFPALMQGKDGSESIISALEKIQEESNTLEFDLLVIIRGGGAQSDLDCFDDYTLAVKIANFHLPIITGIGHERDETIADLVAHTKMKTPTAVAEFILNGFRELEAILNDKLTRLHQTISVKIHLEEKKINGIESKLKLIWAQHINRHVEQLLFRQDKLKGILHNELKLQELKIETFRKSLLSNWKNTLDQNNEKLLFLEKDLKNLNPEGYLKRGYTKSEINGVPVQYSQSIAKGAELITYTSNIKIISEIKNIENE